ncbi:pectate lyase family protein [Actinoallomurus iriomotensis]|uniref:Pectate lyase n=1 Tax=Actinoallomurus iriomotensis TaxID=478107 RepID=A0A9W6RNS5_9ACTN|nr:right-handed parallel beta-helix repeat-containing protein [Actinoallomurus iriomotensis]GLY79114.1 pectate lyase [Actinoallomurus iriomotensis]
MGNHNRLRPLGAVVALALGVSALAGSAAAATTAAVAPLPLAESSPVGWASQSGGTTGGTGGTTVTVTSASQLADYASRSGSYVIKVNSTISLSSMTKVTSNKTIIGVGMAGRITGYGLNVNQANNVVIRNLTFTGSADDAINVQYSTHVWIDHNDLSNAYDGATDIKRASDYVTVSWNHYHDQNKNALLGHDDGNGSEDLGHLRVTYVHNWFDGTVQRNPRVRFGSPVHVLNNYYNGNSGYGVASTCDAGVLVEKNYFEKVEHPTVVQTGDSPEGDLRLVDNYLTGSGTAESRNASSVPNVPYSYSADSASTVKSVVTAGAGVGKI